MLRYQISAPCCYAPLMGRNSGYREDRMHAEAMVALRNPCAIDDAIRLVTEFNIRLARR